MADLGDEQIMAAQPILAPQTRLVWSAIVEVGARIELGESPHGVRFMIPILGGSFYGGTDFPRLSGEVLAGGADRQLLRKDGAKELDALYEMRTNTGDILTIHNQVIIDESLKPERYALSTVKIRAPEGEFGWLNRRVFAGTLQPLATKQAAVLIRVFVLMS